MSLVTTCLFNSLLFLAVYAIGVHVGRSSEHDRYRAACLKDGHSAEDCVRIFP